MNTDQQLTDAEIEAARRGAELVRKRNELAISVAVKGQAAIRHSLESKNKENLAKLLKKQADDDQHELDRIESYCADNRIPLGPRPEEYAQFMNANFADEYQDIDFSGYVDQNHAWGEQDENPPTSWRG